MQLGIASWEGRLAPVFDSAEQLILVTIEPDQPMQRKAVGLAGPWPLQRAQAVIDLGIQVLLCGAISRPAATLLQTAGVKVVPWLGGPCEEILQAYLEGSLKNSDYSLPCGCPSPACRRARVRRGQGGGGRGQGGGGRGQGGGGRGQGGGGRGQGGRGRGQGRGRGKN